MFIRRDHHGEIIEPLPKVDPRQSGESFAELETKVGLNLLDTMIYHQETIEHHLADQSFPVGGDEVLLELLEILKEFTEGIDPDG
jgi:hypothetical protein